MADVPATNREVLIPEVVEEDDNPDRARLRNELRLRREKSTEEGQIDNSALWAGSPMYYYCKYCGVPTDTKPETWISQPKTVCDDCQTLIELGWHDGNRPSFPYKNSR